MKDFPIVPYPEIPKLCASPDHYFNMIVDGKCFSCNKAWGLSDPREALDDEQTKHREFPTDETINEMYALVGSDSTNYREAHD